MKPSDRLDLVLPRGAVLSEVLRRFWYPRFPCLNHGLLTLPDRVSKAVRSETMRAVKREGTSPEILIRNALRRAHVRFRANDRRLPGTPDLCLPSWRTAILVHGCFWHRHAACADATTPRSNRAYWLTKFARNMIRDRENIRALRALRWRVIVIWTCQLRRPSTIESLLCNLRSAPSRVRRANSTHHFTAPVKRARSEANA